MDHSQRGTNSESTNAASATTNLMPNVLFREIHKNAFLKRHSSDRRAGFPRKTERVWVVFCVHDDIEPFLEIYPDQKVALTHKPEWFASLSNVLHVSPTICGHEDEFEFAITLSFQVVRLSAPSWESMMEWVETIRNKLRELKVLCPKENIYSKMPEQKQPLLPTRDPNSPLPLPPEGPSTLLPGVELVHLESRNTPPVVTNNLENGRYQRVSHSRSNDHDRRAMNKRINLQERGVTSESSLPNESSSSAFSENSEGVASSSSNSQAGKVKVKRTICTAQPTSSTTTTVEASNITVIEVSTSRVTENNVTAGQASDNEDDEVFSNNQSVCEETTVNNNADEAHYEHVFLPSVSVTKAQPPPCKAAINCVSVSGNKNKKTQSTSVVISSVNLNKTNSSQNENLPSTSNSKEVHVSESTCLNISKNSTVGELEVSDKSPLSPQIQSKLEKVSITGLIPRVPAKSKTSAFKPASPTFKESNVNVFETKRSSFESGCSFTITDEQNVTTNGDNSRNAAGVSIPTYSQVKKVPKVKEKSEVLRNEEQQSNQISSPVFSKRKVLEIQVLEGESHRKPENHVGNKNQVFLETKSPSNINSKLGSRKQEIGNVVVSDDIPRNHSAASVSNNENRNAEISTSVPSTSGNSNQINLNRKESFTVSNNNPETEPITAVVQPPVGVISVEDIPLIGGHQRRRRRSSSSDPAPLNNTPSSRGIGGADRIRINVPNNSTRDTQRNESDIRSTGNSRSITEPNVSSRLTLREKQVLQLKKEMLHPGGVRLQLRRKDCMGSIAFVDVLNGVWIAGWKQKEHPLLYNALHIGDQLISVGEVLVRNSTEAHKLIRCSSSLYIEFIIRRVPFGNVFALQRSSEGQALGIVQEGNTAEIKDVVPNSIAARQGLTSKTPSCDRLSLTTWFLTEINGRPLNLFFKDNEVRDRLNAVGKEISILVQPSDFIKQIKKQLKNVRSYKDYIVQ